MRLTCPNCSTQYEVADAAIPAEGRDVQCGACQKVWFQTPAAGLAAATVATAAVTATSSSADRVPDEASAPQTPSSPAADTSSASASPAASEFEEPEPQDVKTDVTSAAAAALNPGSSGQPPKTEASDAFAAISRRIAREAEALESGGETPRTTKMDVGVEPDTPAPERTVADRPAFEEPKKPAEPLTEPQRSDEVANVVDGGPTTPPQSPGPAEPSEDEVAAALAEITRPDAPRPSATIATDTVAALDDIAEDVTAAVAEDTTSNEKKSTGRGFLTAVSAAAAGVATARAGESDEAGIAAQIKQRVKDAAGSTDAIAEIEEQEQQVFGASAEAVAEAAAEEVDTRLPDADSLASSLRSDIAGAKEESSSAARGSGFWGGFGAAVGVAACAAVIYLAAPTIGRVAPPLQPLLDSYVGQVNGVRAMIGG